MLYTLIIHYSPLPLQTSCVHMEDYIAQQDIIVPVVVGGILSVLLAAYALRRRKEAKERQYEPLAGANK